MMPSTPVPSASTQTQTMKRLAWSVLAGWFVLAVALAASNMLAGRPPLIPLAILSLTVSGVVAYRRSAPLRAWVHALDMRVPILFHAVRAPIGAWFLVVHARGELPAEFALRGGYGDIVAGVLAVVAALVARPKVTLAFNVIGLADIVMVVLTAQKLILLDRDATMLSVVERIPAFGMLPLFVVPLVFLTHLAIFAKLRRPQLVADAR